MTLAGDFLASSSKEKQSVLVKRVFGDGRVVSGLDTYPDRSELMEEDQGTLGSQMASNGNVEMVARESNIVNYATNGSD